MLSAVDLHWAAGFLEGEGCFRWHPGILQANGKRTAWYPAVEAPQKQREPLERLQRMFGFGSIKLEKGQSGPIYRWRTTRGRHAIGLVQTLWPLLSPKRRAEVEYMIARWCEHRANRPKGYSMDRGNGWL